MLCRNSKKKRQRRESLGAALTMPSAVPLQHDAVSYSDSDDEAAPGAKSRPSLSHRMKHDKSILALAVSSQYIFAGTQGGELLVCTSEGISDQARWHHHQLMLPRYSVSTRMSAAESYTRTKAVSSVYVYRKTSSCSSRVQPTP